jgi:glutaconate CoA-transferase, subunit A
MDKRISLEQAVAQVSSGSTLAVGGVTLYRRPLAFIRALIRRYQQEKEPKDLTLLAFTAGIESDLLVGCGMVKRIRSCYFGLEIFGLAPMFTYYANRGEVEISEETEASLSFGLRAQMASVGFMPGRAWLGTDLPRLRPDVRTVVDPYSGEELIAFPAIRSDVAIIHALKADFNGNAVIGGNKGVDLELCQTTTKIFITAEEIVPSLQQADIIAPYVSGIIEAPGGAKPTSCYPNYPLDGEQILAYSEQVSDQQSFDKFLAGFL